MPAPVVELCAHLEERGIQTLSQGEGLLEDLRQNDVAPAWGGDRKLTRSMLCTADSEQLLRALPQAVVTSADEQRLTQATAWGPVDLIPIGGRRIEDVLSDFGLTALALAYRPADERWHEAADARAALSRGALDCTSSRLNAFVDAPRRYWIAARLIAEHGLVATPELIDSAREALPAALDRLPKGAPARRALDRVLAAPDPQGALAFLREVGITPTLFPGATPANEPRIAQLAALPALRWAAWLRGGATQRALVQLRMPAQLARDIERFQRAHPIDRSVESLREVGVRRILQRFEPEEIEALFAWRRLELSGEPANDETRLRRERLGQIESRIAEARAHQARSGHIRELAIDGSGVMRALGAGPGRHVGRALAHLAGFIEAHPDRNEREPLEAELRAWATEFAEEIG